MLAISSTLLELRDGAIKKKLLFHYLENPAGGGGGGGGDKPFFLV